MNQAEANKEFLLYLYLFALPTMEEHKVGLIAHGMTENQYAKAYAKYLEEFQRRVRGK